MAFGSFIGSSTFLPTRIPSPIEKEVRKVEKKILNRVKDAVVGEIERKTGISIGEKKWAFKDSPALGSHIRVRRMKVPNVDIPKHYLLLAPAAMASLVIDRRGANVYEHHGIYIGNNKVIHFAAPDGDFSLNIKIRKTTLDKFLDGGELEVRDFDAVDNDQRYSNDMVVKRAKRALQNQDFGSYNLLTNNCEHFANYCVFGERFSEQTGDSEPSDEDDRVDIFDRLSPFIQT